MNSANQSPVAVCLPFDTEAEWLEARRRGLTSTDVAAILGLIPKYRTALDVYLDKLGLSDPIEQSAPMEWGKRLETPVLAKYAEEAAGEGWTVVPREGFVLYARHDIPHVLTSIDAHAFQTLDDQTKFKLVEAKTASVRMARFWGEPGTDQVPREYLVQCMWQMIVTGIHECDLAVLIGGNDYRVYHIPYNPELADMLLEAAADFMQNNVMAQVPPPPDGSERYAKLIQEQHPADDYPEMISAGEELEDWLEKRMQADEDEKAAAARKTEAENHLKAAIGDKTGIVGTAYTMYWKRVRDSVGVNYSALVEELKKDHPELPWPELIKRHTGITRKGTRKVDFKEN